MADTQSLLDRIAEMEATIETLLRVNKQRRDQIRLLTRQLDEHRAGNPCNEVTRKLKEARRRAFKAEKRVKELEASRG